jgi:hypothetical protein
MGSTAIQANFRAVTAQLPDDFSWCNKKAGKIYQIITKIPNVHSNYQMAVQYSK